MKKTHKLITMLLCMVSLASFSSCSKGDSDIIGKWKVTAYNFNDNGNDMSTEIRIGDIWEFKDDGIFIAYGETSSYSVSGNNITIAEGMHTGSITSLSDSKLVLDLIFAVNFGDNPYPTEHIELSKI